MALTLEAVIEAIGSEQTKSVHTLTDAAIALSLPVNQARALLGEKANRFCTRNVARKERACRGKTSDAKCPDCQVGRAKLLATGTTFPARTSATH
jgi:hypothetical protein